MRVLPNPRKGALNRRRHGLDFSQVGDVLANEHIDEADDRPLGYEHEARRRITGRIGLQVVILVIEPVEIGPDEMALKPISLRPATRDEEVDYWTQTRW